MVIIFHFCEYVLLGWQTVPEFTKLCWVVLSEEGGGQPEAETASPGHALQGGRWSWYQPRPLDSLWEPRKLWWEPGGVACFQTLLKQTQVSKSAWRQGYIMSWTCAMSHPSVLNIPYSWKSKSLSFLWTIWISGWGRKRKWRLLTFWYKWRIAWWAGVTTFTVISQYHS